MGNRRSARGCPITWLGKTLGHDLNKIMSLYDKAIYRLPSQNTLGVIDLEAGQLGLELADLIQ